jgi:hypothetical protein
MTLALRAAACRPARAVGGRVAGPALCVFHFLCFLRAAGRRGPTSQLLTTTTPHLHKKQTRSRRARLAPARAAEPGGGDNAPGDSPPPSPPGTPPPPQPVRSPREEGSTTALVTGAISVVIGLAYLALVAALNNRGELLPPPPEAFGP